MNISFVYLRGCPATGLTVSCRQTVTWRYLLQTLGRSHVTRTLSTADYQRVRGVAPRNTQTGESPGLLTVVLCVVVSCTTYCVAECAAVQSHASRRPSHRVTLQRNVSGTWPALRRAPTLPLLADCCQYSSDPHSLLHVSSPLLSPIVALYTLLRSDPLLRPTS